MPTSPISLKPGTKLGPYEIAAPLGVGGMGEVYRARDTRLGRDVALKVLPPELAATPEARSRFEREARAIAALNHPHICTLHDIGREGETEYLVLELLDGVTLRDRLSRGPMSPEETVSCGAQIARALGAAHERGIVHRDLKPENVLLTRSGQAKVLDFGLALQTAPGAGGKTLAEGATLPGTLLGTIGYMSPEQVRGEAVDPRSDIFSLGCVLHEMLSGASAFRRDTAAESLSAILRDDPPPLGAGSTGLERVVRRCLAKNPAERFPSAQHVLEALEGARDGTEPSAPPSRGEPGATAAPSVAVLPFSDMSAARDHEWFCDGMAEEIIGALARIPGLRVAARSSTFQFKGQAQDVHRIGDALHVNKIVEGSVRTAGNRLRVTAQLINVADGYQIWSERYDREMEDVFAIQDDIAASVARALEVTLRPGSEVRPAPERNLEAYQLYLRGRHYRLAKIDLQRALRCFEEAVALDPADPRIRAGLADVLTMLGHYGSRPPREMYARARAEIDVALGLDGNSAEALTMDGAISIYYERDFEAAERSLRRAQARDPRHVQAWVFGGILFAVLGRDDEAEAAVRRAQEVDPLSSYANYLAGLTLLLGGRHEKAVVALDTAIEIDPDNMQALWTRGVAYVASGELDRAVVTLEHAVTRSGRAMYYVGLLGWALALSGRTAEARRLLEEWEARSRSEYASATSIVPLLMELGETERAWDLAFETCEAGELWILMVRLPWFDRMRDDPRFPELRRRLGLPASPA